MPYHQRQPNPLIGCVSLARLLILCTLSKSDLIVIMWSPSGCTTVGPDCPDVLSSPCLLITTWQLVKSPGVTRNEPKIHVMCYITQFWSCHLVTIRSTIWDAREIIPTRYDIDQFFFSNLFIIFILSWYNIFSLMCILVVLRISWWSFTGVWMTASLQDLAQYSCHLKNAVSGMVCTHSLISKFSSHITKPLKLVPSAPITIGITVTFMFQSFLLLSKVHTSLFIFLFSLCVLLRCQSPLFSRFSFFFGWRSLSVVFWLGLSDLFVSWNPKEFLSQNKGLLSLLFHFLRWSFPRV